FGNAVKSGYYWGADWTGKQHIAAGDAGTQYADDGQYDLDVFKPGLPFWDAHPTTAKPAPAPAPTTTNPETIGQQLPLVKTGAAGATVRTVQGLVSARGHAVTIDGIYGPNTDAAVRSVQAAGKIAEDGVVGPATWPVLMGVA